MKNENKTKILFLVIGIVIGIVITLLFQIAIQGDANKILRKNKVSISAKTNMANQLGMVEDCLESGGTAILNPNPYYGDDGTYYPHGTFDCVIDGVSNIIPLTE